MDIPRPSPSHSPLAGALSKLRRRPSLYWLATAAVAAVTGVLAMSIVGAAAADRERLGGVQPAVVAVRSLPAGHRLGAGDTETRMLPRAALPDRAFEDEEAATGEVLAVPVVRGEVLTAQKLAPAGLGPVAGLLPPGTRGLAVPDGAGGLRLAPGDVVDVLATFPPEAAGEHEPTFAVATAAVVVDVADDAVTVAVDTPDVPRVAYALAQGLVTLALSGAR